MAIFNSYVSLPDGIYLPFSSKIHPEPLADAPGHSPQPARIGISPLTQQQLEPETSDLQGGLGPCHGKMRWNMVEDDSVSKPCTPGEPQNSW